MTGYLNGLIQNVQIEILGNESCSNALNLVSSWTSPRDDWALRRFHSNHLSHVNHTQMSGQE